MVLVVRGEVREGFFFNNGKSLFRVLTVVVSDLVYVSKDFLLHSPFGISTNPNVGGVR